MILNRYIIRLLYNIDRNRIWKVQGIKIYLRPIYYRDIFKLADLDFRQLHIKIIMYILYRYTTTKNIRKTLQKRKTFKNISSKNI